MNFFKSILSDDPDPDPQQSDPEQQHQHQQSHSTNIDVDPEPNSSKPDPSTESGDIWSFGGIFKTITTRSESVLETYRKDLQEFGSGLKKETELFREVASRAVKDLPNSIEVIDGVIKSTAEIISQGKDSLLADIEPETPDTYRSVNSGRYYSRFESQLISIQNDPNTFCVEPEDLGDYEKWKLGFDLKGKSEEVEDLLEKNESLEVFYKRVVPDEVDDETFWCRYFYRVDKLKLQESVRAKLVKRAISVDEDDEELSWDVDDDDDEDNGNEQASDVKSKVDELPKEGSVVKSSVSDLKNESGAKDSNDVAKEVTLNESEPSKEDSIDVVKQATHNDESQSVSSAAVDKKEEDQSKADGAGKIDVVESCESSNDSKKEDSEVASQGKKEEGVVKGSEEKGEKEEGVVKSSEGNSEKEEGVVKASEGKGEKDKSGKEGDLSVVSSQKTGADEEDLDWADIEDIEGNDDKKPTSHVATSNRADLKKRLSIEEDDEDLSWDIEDDDEPVKA